VLNHTAGQVFQVPTAPLEALINRLSDGVPMRVETLAAINTALSQIAIFNQLVGLQTVFNATHFPDIKNSLTSSERRIAIANAAQGISKMLHSIAISDALWYSSLIKELGNEIASLETHRKNGWRSDVWLWISIGSSIILVSLSVAFALRT
jgi:hypothetical protein